MGREHIAQKLIREIAKIRLRQLPGIEDVIEVSIRRENSFFSPLKISFGEFGFDQQTSQLHIRFGSIHSAISQWNPSLDSEPW